MGFQEHLSEITSMWDVRLTAQHVLVCVVGQALARPTYPRKPSIYDNQL